MGVYLLLSSMGFAHVISLSAPPTMSVLWYTSTMFVIITGHSEDNWQLLKYKEAYFF